MVTVGEIREITGNGDRWLVYDGDNLIFTGWVWELADHLLNGRRESTLYKAIKDREVKQLKFHLDIKHKEWQERGLVKPLMPDETPQYSYSDLREDLFYEIHI